MESQPTWVPTAKIEDLFPSPTRTSNSASAAPREEKDVPMGSAPIQLFSIATPNGKKLGIMLEELGVEYDAHGYLQINPNNKIPSIYDREGLGGAPMSVFESAAELTYLAEKYGKFIPKDPVLRTQLNSWLFWQVGGLGPTVGTFAYFFIYCPADKIETRNYGVSRYGMDTLRHLDVLERHLAGKTYMVGEEYSIADIAIFPWVEIFRSGYKHPSGLTAAEYLSFEKFVNLNAWIDRIAERPAVKRGLTVCSFDGTPKPWLKPN